MQQVPWAVLLQLLRLPWVRQCKFCCGCGRSEQLRHVHVLLRLRPF